MKIYCFKMTKIVYWIDKFVGHCYGVNWVSLDQTIDLVEKGQL